MSRKKYILQIQNPCEEKWSEMTPNEAGRFCAHCSKTVVDFTKMNDRQIAQLLENSSEKMCGRLLSDQMNRVITDYTENIHYKFPRLVAGLLLAGTATNAIAQTSEVKTEVVSPQDTTIEYLMGKVIMPEQVKIDSSKNFIQGTIIDENKEGVIGAKVRIANSRIETFTDYDGNFKLYIPDNLNSQSITLSISSIGASDSSITILPKQMPFKIKKAIVLTMYRTTGMVVVFDEKKFKKQLRENKKKHK